MNDQLQATRFREPLTLCAYFQATRIWFCLVRLGVRAKGGSEADAAAVDDRISQRCVIAQQINMIQ